MQIITPGIVYGDELNIGQAYYHDNGEIFLYLGHGNMRYGNINKHGYLASSIGYLMMSGNRMVYYRLFKERISVLANSFLTCDLESCAYLIESSNKPIEFIGKFNYKSPIVEKKFRYISNFGDNLAIMDFDLEDES
jgi:hypothetical protein